MPQVHDCVILIPSLHPDLKLIEYTDDLAAHGFSRIVVVDDGSGPAYREVFDKIGSKPECAVLSYQQNQGKGHALKHGFSYILEHFKDAPDVVTADADGQHTAGDCERVAAAMLSEPEKLVLGTRDFSQANVPAKSRTGNRLTSIFFLMLYGHWLPDTQTGLRGMSMDLLPKLLGIPGERFEWEMNELIHFAGWHLDFVRVPIDTIYLEENSGSHFRPLLDSFRIYALLFSNFFKFASSSATSTVLDLGLFTVLVKWVLPYLFPALSAGRPYYLVLLATAVARVCSSVLNFFINRQFVFQMERHKGAFLRYALLVIVVLFTSATLVNALNVYLSLDRTVAKIIVDSLLFFVNYRVQKAWVFSKPRKGILSNEK